MLNVRLAGAAALALVAGLTFAAPAQAQAVANSATTTYIGGDVTIDAKTNVLASIIVGDNSTARADQGIIYEGTTVRGSVNMHCRSNVQAAIVVGDNSHASASQCSIGAPKH